MTSKKSLRWASFSFVALVASSAQAQESTDLAPPVELPDSPEGNHDGDAIPGGSGESGFNIRSLLQVRYQQTSADGGGILDRDRALDNDGYRLERAFLRFTDDPSKQVGVKVLFDLAELTRKNVKQSVKLAYMRLRPFKRLELTFGVQKRPFSLLELNPIASYELANVGVIDDLIKDLEFGGRDVGAMARVEPLAKKKWLRLFLGAFKGQASGREASAAGVINARVTTKPIKAVELGADVAWHPTDTEAIDKGVATSGDATIEMERFSLRLEGLWGTRDDVLTRLQAKHFLGSWALASYQIPVGNLVLMPALRAEWVDLDRGHAGGAVTLLSGAMNVLLPQGVRLLLDVSHTNAQAGAYRTDGTAYLDSWTFVSQVQLML
jgi:hypothetical protein